VSSNPAVASITNSGLATGLLTGSTTITATSGMVSSNHSTLMVTASTISSITVTPPAPSIQVGQTQQFVATAMDANGNPIAGMTFTWASSNSMVASIVGTGLATGISGGTTTITATSGTVSSNPSTLTVTTGGGGGRVYTTNFPLAENPISEGGNWINGKTTGLDWADFSSTPGLAIGMQSGTNPLVYDDSIALVTGTWGPDQTVQVVVKTVNQNNAIFEELEIRLRSTITPHSSTGYEINWSARSDSTAYLQIVRWNGPMGDFTYVCCGNSGSAVAMHDGDVLTASMIGSTITVYINGVQAAQGTDTTFTTGNPGIGAFLANATSVNGDYGFTSFRASD